MIWVLGGTSDGLDFSNYLGSRPHIVSLGTREGQDYYDRDNFVFKRMGQDQMEDFIRDNKVSLVVDLTHPFALEVSANAKKASEKMQVPYERFERPSLTYPDSALVFDDYDQALEYLQTYKGDLLISTGVNMAHRFRQIQGSNRFVYRILPMVDSVTKVHDLGINLKDIIAMVGPFSKDLNIQIIKDFDLDGLIMKDSGAKGGSPEKIQACLETGIDLFIIKRDQEGQVFDEFFQMIKDRYLD